MAKSTGQNFSTPGKRREATPVAQSNMPPAADADGSKLTAVLRSAEESEARFKSLVSNLPGVVYRTTCGEEPKDLFVSEGIEHITGNAAGEFGAGKARTMRDFILPEDRDLVTAVKRRAAMTRQPFIIEYRIRHRDGTIRWLQDRGRVCFGDDHAPLYVDGVMFDVTKQKEKDDSLRTAQARLVDAIESVETGFGLFDVDDRLILCNSAYHQTFGVTGRDFARLVGMTYEEVLRWGLARGLYPEAGTDVEGWVESRLEEHQATSGSEQVHRVGGRWVRTYHRGTADSGIVVASADITDLKRAAEGAATADATVAAAAAADRKLQGNPLQAIKPSLADMRRLAAEKGLAADDLLDQVEQGIERCNNVMLALVDFARGYELARESTDIDMFVDTIVEQQKLPSEVSLRSRLGAGCDVALDRKGFRKVIDHLLENAVHALLNSNWTPTDGRKPTITIRTEHAGPHVRITVSDNGPGIPPETMRRIFEPLFTTKRTGDGLGLSTARKIIELHGGTIDVDSAVDQGTDFTIWLPRFYAEKKPVPGSTSGKSASIPA
jgi:PAS domain S-box-containing protein